MGVERTCAFGLQTAPAEPWHALSWRLVEAKNELGPTLTMTRGVGGREGLVLQCRDLGDSNQSYKDGEDELRRG